MKKSIKFILLSAFSVSAVAISIIAVHFHMKSFVDQTTTNVYITVPPKDNLGSQHKQEPLFQQPSEPTNVVNEPIKREHIRTAAPTQKTKRKSISPIVSETKKSEESQLETPEANLVDSDSAIPKHEEEKEESDKIVKERLDNKRSKFEEQTIKSQKHEDISHRAQEQIRRLRDKIGKDKTKQQEETQKESSAKDSKNGIMQNADKALEDLKKKTTDKINEEKTDE